MPYKSALVSKIISLVFILFQIFWCYIINRIGGLTHFCIIRPSVMWKELKALGYFGHKMCIKKTHVCGKKVHCQGTVHVPECPSHPSESLTCDTSDANLALSLLHLPTLTRTTDTCHTFVSWEDRGDKKCRNMVPVIKWGHFKWESLLCRMVITH